MTHTPQPLLPPARPSRPGLPHEAGAWIVGWHNPDTRSIGGVSIIDLRNKMGKFRGERVRVFGWLRQEAPDRPARLMVVNVRRAHSGEQNDLHFKVIGVLIRHDRTAPSLRIDVCPAGDTRPFSVSLPMTRSAARTITSDTYAVTARGGLINGVGLVVDALEAAHAPVPERWRTWRANRRKRNLARKQRVLQDRQDALKAARLAPVTADPVTADPPRTPPLPMQRWMTLRC